MRSIPDGRARYLWTGLLGAVVVISAAAGACTIARERPAGGLHPDGWIDEKSANFHGTTLKKSGYPLAECRACHGDDYAGGAVGSSCLGECHSEGVEACHTCHGGEGPPHPDTGAHTKHQIECESCHVVPVDARGGLHPNGNVDVVFSGLAAMNIDAAWDPAGRQCSNVYCHGGAAIAWDPPAPDLQCTGCHAAPPASHDRWKTDAAPEGCTPCHPIGPDPRHIDGKIDVLSPACDTCHGHGPLGIPSPSLAGDVDPAVRAVGAHRRHTDDTLADRIGAVVECATCHPVPTSVNEPQHLDSAAPADVVLPQGETYDPATGTCVVACHWDRSPGPAWTNASGAERACDACHGFPPATTRKGTAHPSSLPDLGACLPCHTYDPARHVDGHVDFVQ